MTLNARFILAAVLVFVLSAAVFTTAAPMGNPLLDLKSIGSASSLEGEPDCTFSITISDEFFSADEQSGFLAVAPGAAAPKTIAKVQVSVKNVSKDLLANGLDFTIRESCEAKAAWDAQGRGNVATSGADWAAYASGNLAGKYGYLATSGASNQNTIVSETQSNNDKAGVTRVIMDPTISAAQHGGKTLVVTTANAPVRQLACIAI
ncbi:hypothetical protein GGF32_008204 [Allomyces javanicus]|nr:hypothetical protein GGF32_008204 [Allomyces javanicus]